MKNRRNVTYREIRELVTEVRRSRGRLMCVFVCPVSGLTVASDAALEGHDRERPRGRVLRRCRRLLRQLVGRRSGDADALQAGAIVAAFAAVREHFAWLEREARYVHRSVAAADHACGRLGGRGVGA